LDWKNDNFHEFIFYISENPFLARVSASPGFKKAGQPQNLPLISTKKDPINIGAIS
jgi:hypothetical protein